jgi:exoribonuclease R
MTFECRENRQRIEDIER